jgi:arylsulfatase
LLSGQHPDDPVGEGFSRRAPTLSMLLPKEYPTTAFHSNPYLSRAYGYDEGFDRFYDDLRLGQNKLLALIQRAIDKFVLSRGEYHARAEEINELALSWIDSLHNDGPFFFWNHYMDVHGPYNPPQGYGKWSESISDVEAQRLYDGLSGSGNLTESEVESSRNLYDGEIRYVDDQINTFIEELDLRGHLDESLIIMTYDHGDLLGEYGQYAHPRDIYPELNRVPFLISAPELPAETGHIPVSTTDVVPTALDATGKSSSELPGASLLDWDTLEEDRFVFNSAIGENDDDDISRLAVQAKNRGFRFTREHTTREIVDETVFELPSGRIVEDIESTEFKVLRTALVEYSEERINQAPRQIEQGPEDNADIEERREALLYK